MIQSFSRVFRRVVVIAPLVVLSALVCGTHAVRADIIGAVNSTLAPDPNSVWGLDSIGWVYTPTASATLIGVQTRFGSLPFNGDADAVTLEVYSGVPSLGGNRLASTVFTPADVQFAGGTFSTPVSLTAGQNYFIGFRGVGGSSAGSDPSTALGVNVIDPNGPSGTVLPTYSSTDPAAPYSTLDTEAAHQSPILLLSGQLVSTATPEAGSGTLASAVLLVCFAIRIRRRANSC